MASRNERGPAVVYEVVCSVNGKRYVGVTSRGEQQRLAEHVSEALVRRRNNGHFYRAIRKHGPEAFSIRVLFVCPTLGEAKEAEIRFIAALRPEYNSTKGGDGQLGRKFSKTTRRKIGAAHIGKAHHNRPHSDATRQRLREVGLSLDNQLRWTLYQGLGPAAASRKVVCLDDGTIFPSASEAARAYEVAKSALIELCLGQRGRKTVGGRRFAYVE